MTNVDIENTYLMGEINKCLNKRDMLDVEFGKIVERLDHLKEDTCLNGFRNIYDESVYNNVIRLKEIVDKIEYYDMLVTDYRRHIDRNNHLKKKN